MAPDTGGAGPLAVYLHWPYCARICPYCDFNVHLNKRAGEAAALVEAMVADLRSWRALTGERTIGSVHFGGGTPSLLTRSQLDRLLGEIRALWGVPAAAEIALEANPNDITASRLDDWRGAGINRLSIGVQSFDDAVLSQLGRDHDGAQAHGAIAQAVAAIPSVSVDLIFGVAGEGEGRLSRDLDMILDLGVQHISTYQLTIEPGTAFARAEARGADLAAGEERSASDFETIDARLCAAGFEHYEVSNFARAGHRSQHNLAYWRGRDYVGVGPGAHGRLWRDGVRLATETPLRPTHYIDVVAQDGTAMQTDALSPADAASEYVMMGLRTVEGISPERLSVIAGEARSIPGYLFEDGLLERGPETVKATPKGRILLDALTRAILL